MTCHILAGIGVMFIGLLLALGAQAVFEKSVWRTVSLILLTPATVIIAMLFWLGEI